MISIRKKKKNILNNIKVIIWLSCVFQNITESTSQVSTVNQPETSTLPSLPEEGKAKSRRKPGFRSEEEPSSKDEGENVKDVSFFKGFDFRF